MNIHCNWTPPKENLFGLPSHRRKFWLAIVVLYGLIALHTIVWAQANTTKQKSFSKEQASAFLQDDFTIITKVESLPETVRAALAKEFHEPTLEMANPGEGFNATDVGKPGKRLVFAGSSGNKFFVHYEQGGIAYCTYVILLHVESPNAVQFLWSGASCNRRVLRELPQLRAEIAAGHFDWPKWLK